MDTFNTMKEIWVIPELVELNIKKTEGSASPNTKEDFDGSLS